MTPRERKYHEHKRIIRDIRNRKAVFVPLPPNAHTPFTNDDIFTTKITGSFPDYNWCYSMNVVN